MDWYPSIVATVAAGLTTAAVGAETADWPRFRGPHGDGISRETGLLQSWPAEGPKKLWTASGCGEGFASVAIQAGTIYTAGRFGKECRIVALDVDGKPKWTAANGEEWGGDQKGSRATPALADGRLYHLNGSGRLGCFDPATGKEIWAKNILETFGGRNIGWGISESVLVTDGKVICTPGGKEAALAALDPKTGAVVWTTAGIGEAAGYCSPSVIEFGGRRLVVTFLAKSLVGVDLATGRLLWRLPHETSYDVNCAMPVYANGCLYASTGYNKGGVMVKLKKDGDGVGVDQIWSDRKLDNHHGGVVLVNGYIYGADSKSTWHCLDLATGAVQYSDGGVGKGSVTVADGLLFCLSEGGRLGIRKADPKSPKPVSECAIPGGGQGPVWAYPVVCGGRLYVRHGDLLHAFSVKAP